MFDVLELPRQLTQGFYDFVADELYTVAQYFGIVSEDQPFDIPLLFSGYGCFYFGGFNDQPPAPSGGWVGYANSALCNVNISQDNVDIYSTYWKPTNPNLSSEDVNNITAWFDSKGNLTPVHTVLSPLSVETYQLVGDYYFRLASNGNYDVLSMTPPINVSTPPLTRTSVNFQNSGSIDSPFLPDWMPYGSSSFNVGLFNDVQHISTFDSNVFYKGDYTPHTITLSDGSTIITYSSDSGLILPISDMSLSWKDIQNIFDGSSPSELSLNFPDFEIMKDLPFAYIEPIHRLNYSLELPDTSDYLDVSVVSIPLNTCSDIFDYMWSNITALGFAPVLGFALVVTLIVKGLRGD